MDYQCSLYELGNTKKSYLQCLREASSQTIFDYYSREPIPVDALSAREMIRAMHERTLMSPAVTSILNDICIAIYEHQKGVQRHYKSWLEMRNWALDLFQGEGNWIHRGYKGTHKKDIFATLFSRIVERLPAASGKGIADLPCHGLFTNDVSAYLVSSPKGEAGIVIPWNLYFYMYSGCIYLFDYINNFIQHTGGKDEKKDQRVEKICEQRLREICSNAAQCCDAGPSLIRLPSLLSFDPIYGTLLDQPRMDASVITQGALYFIILHEIGHVIKGHLSTKHYIPVLSEDNEMVLYSTSILQEDEADSFAITNFLRFALDIIPGPTYLKLLGPPFVFALYRLREAVFSRWKQFVNEQLNDRGALHSTNSYQVSLA